ncbi:MAG: hypothetical protein CL949_00475 [Erythrobacter sp.]|nr:hypothetical protein [Erythrobacter sp.]
MTTIILSILGILLAAAAALMVVFYGGTAFEDSSTEATANSLQNAGANVLAASDMYQFENGRLPSTLDDLTNNGRYLAAEPDIVGFQANHNFEIHSSTHRNYAVFPVPPEVCLKVNQNVGVNDNDDEVADIPNGRSPNKVGCWGSPGWYTFQVRLGT